MLKALAIAPFLIATGCASIVSDSEYPVRVSAVPWKTEFEIYDENNILVHSGYTPSTVKLKAGDGYFDGQRYTIKFRKTGYQDQTTQINTSLDGWYWGNILLGGLIGMLIVDPLTGAMYKLPSHTSANLIQGELAPPNKESAQAAPAALLGSADTRP